MATLTGVLSQSNPYPAGLTWVSRPEDDLTSAVSDFLEAARTAGVEPVHHVVAGSFGELMTELARACRLTAIVRSRLATLRPAPLRVPSPRPTGTTHLFPQLRFGAVEVTAMSTAARVLSGRDASAVSEIRRALRSADVRAVVGWTAGNLAAFGPDAGLRQALTPLGITVTDDTVPLPPASLDSGGIGLLTNALAHALGDTAGLSADFAKGSSIVRVRIPRAGAQDAQPADLKALSEAAGGRVRGALPKSNVPWAESVTLNLEHHGNTWLLLFAPEIWVRRIRDDDAAVREALEFVRERSARRHNNKAGPLLGAWLTLLTGENGRTVRAFHQDEGAGVNATFTLTSRPIVSQQIIGDPIMIGGNA